MFNFVMYRRELLAVSGALAISGCIGNSGRTENEDGLERLGSSRTQLEQGLFDLTDYGVNLAEGEWVSKRLEVPGDLAVALYTEADQGISTAALMTEDSFTQRYPNESISGRTISHTQGDRRPGYTVAATTGHRNWVLVADNTTEFGQEELDGRTIAYLGVGIEVR